MKVELIDFIIADRLILCSRVALSGDTKALDSILDDGIVLVNDDGSVQTKTESQASVKSSGPVS